MDVFAVGVITGLAIVALVVLIVQLIKERKLYGPKQRELVESAKKVEYSSVSN